MVKSFWKAQTNGMKPNRLTSIDSDLNYSDKEIVIKPFGDKIPFPKNNNKQ